MKTKVHLNRIYGDFTGQGGRLIGVNQTEDGFSLLDSTDLMTLNGGDPIANSITFDSSTNQTQYPFNFSYLPGHRELLVFSGGLFMREGEDYTETDSTSIDFIIGRSLNEKVTVVKLAMKYTNTQGDPFTNVDVNNVDYTCLESQLRLFVDTTNTAVTITFPSNPSQGDEIDIVNAVDSFQTNNVTLDGNGNAIQGSLDDFIIDVNMGCRQTYHIVYGQVLNGSTIQGQLEENKFYEHLDADLLDGYHAGHDTSNIPISDGTVNSTFNADLLDGTHSSGFAATTHYHAGTDITTAITSCTNADTLDTYHAGHAGGQIPINDTTLNIGLNSDLLDGHDATYFAQLSHIHAGGDITSAVANATNADTLDGTHAAGFAANIHYHAGTDVTTAVANATNADTLDGTHAAGFAASSHLHADKLDLTVAQDMVEPTGFIDWDATLSLNDHTFTITGEHNFYNNAVRQTKNTTSIPIDNTEIGMHYIYYNASNVLTTSTNFPGMSVPLVSFIFWNGVKGVASDERHGCIMDAKTHNYLHNTIGARYDYGLAGTFGNTTFKISAGAIQDEDLKSEFGDQTICDVQYKNGALETQSWNSNQTKYYHDDGTQLYYNSDNTLALVPANDYVAYWAFATNSITNPIIFIMGQRKDTNITQARTNNKYENLSFGVMPFKEMKVLFRVLLRGNMTYVETQDLRSVSNVSSGTYVATDHDSLSSIKGGGTYHLSNDQYLQLTDDTQTALHSHDLTDLQTGYKSGFLIVPKDTTSFTVKPGYIHMTDDTYSGVYRLPAEMDATATSIQADKIYGIYASMPDEGTDVTSIYIAKIDTVPPVYMASRLAYYNMAVGGPRRKRLIGMVKSDSLSLLAAFGRIVDQFLVFDDGMISPGAMSTDLPEINKFSPVTKSTDYTMTDTDGYDTFFVSGTTTIVLPLASRSRLIRFAKTDSGATTVTIVTYGPGDTIQGNSYIELTAQYSTVVLASDGVSTQFEF